MTAIFADDIYKARNMIACGLGNYFKRMGEPYELTECGGLQQRGNVIRSINSGISKRGWFVTDSLTEKVKYDYY